MIQRVFQRPDHSMKCYVSFLKIYFNYTVTISGAPFKGFLIVAGEEGSKDWPTGQWYTENDAARPMFCSGKNDAITHTNSRWKDSITLLWYGPTHSTADMIQFM